MTINGLPRSIQTNISFVTTGSTFDKVIVNGKFNGEFRLLSQHINIWTSLLLWMDGNNLDKKYDHF